MGLLCSCLAVAGLYSFILSATCWDVLLQKLRLKSSDAARSEKAIGARRWIGGMPGMTRTKKILQTGKHEAVVDIINALCDDLAG